MLRCENCENFHDESECEPMPGGEIGIVCTDRLYGWADKVALNSPNSDLSKEELAEILVESVRSKKTQWVAI